ncbi:Glu/Leu/Phe/Val dehydrogenase dimerization domain-containing protein [Pseudoalteromonas luteoviolacea]|uniref:Glu/Leu/Phe/Val dehydrogenase dimerization domain-containing protein n=1 Tax=Pseudoalteromonas luteoviolacea TaxID=43657 RepID=UPI0012DACE55
MSQALYILAAISIRKDNGESAYFKAYRSRYNSLLEATKGGSCSYPFVEQSEVEAFEICCRERSDWRGKGWHLLPSSIQNCCLHSN